MKTAIVTSIAMFSLVAQALPVERRGIVDKVDGTLKKLTGIFAGSGTFFSPPAEGGIYGACGGYKEGDNSKIVALNLHQYGDPDKVSDWCFKDVKISHGEKSIVAKITDACPGCNKNSLDLTPSLFQELDKPDIGVIDINWCVIGTDGCTHEKEAVDGGNAPEGDASGKDNGNKDDGSNDSAKNDKGDKDKSKKDSKDKKKSE
ncbi:hypothetical protein BC940DRAFT_309754 [Gongronella butleri]|nr:hypothetical protein BC940DRAFT_309754 [Gongronella butleri]